MVIDLAVAALRECGARHGNHELIEHSLAALRELQSNFHRHEAERSM
jgi:hypothetical protein